MRKYKYFNLLTIKLSGENVDIKFIEKYFHHTIPIIFIFLVLILISITDSYSNDIPFKDISKKSDCVTESKYGSINWTTGVIRSKGRNKTIKKGQSDILYENLMTESAVNNAKEHLFKILESIALLDGSKFKNGESLQLEKKESLQIIVSQMKKQAACAKVIKISSISNQIVEAVLETSMYGDFLRYVLPTQIEDIPDIEILEAGEPYFKIPTNSQYTGIVIDARELKFKPVICPFILNEQGEEIYSPIFISRKYAVERGICSYTFSIDPDIIEQKVGINPIFVKGIRKDSHNDYGIIISMSDADKIQKIAERHIFMKKCKAVIIISP